MTEVELLTGEPKEGESKKAILACNDYLRMGPGRSLAKLHRIYIESTSEKPPAKHLRTLAEWSRAYDWQLRAAAYDAEIERQKNEAVQEIMKSGLALVHERVNELKLLAHWLRQEIFEIDKNGQIKGFKRDSIWLADVKGIGKDDYFERVDLIRFNGPILEKYQSLIDDLAKETGGRRQRQENLNIDFSKLTDDQLERIRTGEDPLDVILSGYGSGGDRAPEQAENQDLD